MSEAFINLRRLLKGTGFAVFSVPYLKHGQTVEHFPELFKFTLEKLNGNYALINTTKDGRQQRFEDLVFHGGEGLILEMRVFAEPSLLEDFSSADLTVKILRENYLRDGIVQLTNHSKIIIVRPRLHE